MAVSSIGRENHRPAASQAEKFDHIILYRVHLARADIELTMLVMAYSDYIGSCKSNYHTITTMTMTAHI